MSLEGNVEYALARVQFQYGARLGAGDWRRLEASRDLGQYLEATRNSIFGPWIACLDRSRDVHAIERTLRGAWRRYVRSVAAWHPRRWQPWLAWLEWLPTLGLITQLEHTAPVPTWLLADPVVGVAVKGSGLAVFEPAIAGRVPLAELWLTRWQELRPQMDATTKQVLAAFCKAVQDHVRRLALEGADAVALRERLRQRLQQLFRTAAGTPVATLCHLALMALDFERLRGGLVNRSLFAGGG
jgi:hypothetical protein